MSVEKTMLLITSNWGDNKSFRLMPVSKECPYSEGIYDPESNVLVIMSGEIKESMHMLPKLDDSGDAIRTKAVRPNKKNYKEQRVQLETFTEYYISVREEIENLISMIAINAESFDYKKYLKEG